MRGSECRVYQFFQQPFKKLSLEQCRGLTRLAPSGATGDAWHVLHTRRMETRERTPLK